MDVKVPRESNKQKKTWRKKTYFYFVEKNPKIRPTIGVFKRNVTRVTNFTLQMF